MTKESLQKKIERTTEYEKGKYYKRLIRFPAERQDVILTAAALRDPGKKSLNGFVVAAVLEKIERDYPNLADDLRQM